MSVEQRVGTVEHAILSEKVVLLTGGAQGMGEYDAEAMLKIGAAVVITDVNVEQGKAVENRLSEFGPCKFLEQDVTSEAGWSSVIEQSVAEFGGIDVLVNNAGITMRSSIENMPADMWDKVMQV